MPSERRPRRWAGLRRAVVSLLGIALLVAASVANAGPLLGDTNCDGEVDQADFDSLVAGLFGGESECPGLDVNGDGIVSAADVVALLEVLPPPAPTASPTPSVDAPTATPTPVTPSITVGASPTVTPSATQGSTRTATITITPTGPTSTRTRTGTITRTPSITRTPTNTRRPTRTTTASATGTITRTASRTRTGTRTRTPGVTIGTPTATPTATPTGPTPTATATCDNCTATATPTRTSTFSGPTLTASRTGTRTRTPSITRTPLNTRTVTRTASNTRTGTATRTTTRSRTATNTRPPTVTRTPPPTGTITLTPTITRTRTPSRTPTATIPRPFGPEITYFGIATADNHVRTPTGETPDGVPIFTFPNPFGFIIVAEGRTGTSGRPLAVCGVGGGAPCGDGRAAMEIIADRPLGNGSAAVCDIHPPNTGGVPAVPALDFGLPQATDPINDLACRFEIHAPSTEACTLNEQGIPGWVRNDPGDPVKSSMQYCSQLVLGGQYPFPSGLTRLKLQIQDASGNVGNQAQIAIQVP